MKAKEASRTYSYLFNSPTRNNQKHSFSSYENSEILAKNATISFRYFGETQENAMKIKPTETDLTKFALLKEKAAPAIKKYTFSGLTKHPKDFYKSEIVDPPAHISSATKAHYSYNPQFEVNDVRKRSVENEEDIIQPSNKKELKTQSSVQNKSRDDDKGYTLLQQKVEDLKHQNELLKVRADEFKRLHTQQQRKLSDLRVELKLAYETIGRQDEMISNLNKKDEENTTKIQELLINLELKQQLKLSFRINHNVFDETVLPMPTNIKVVDGPKGEEKSFIQKYKQIVELFGFQLIHQNCHQQLLNHIQQTQKCFEELTQQSIKFSQIQKEKNKLLHVLKKNQSELARLCHENAFLNHQISKNIQLLSQCNQQINILHIRQIQSRMAAQFFSDD